MFQLYCTACTNDNEFVLLLLSCSIKATDFLNNGPMENHVIEEQQSKLDMACTALKNQADFRLERLKVLIILNAREMK